jgi:subtilisin family serine protease
MENRAMRQRITKLSVVLAALMGLCWLVGFDVFSAHAQSSMRMQGRAPVIGSRGGMTGMPGRGGMHGGYRPGWGHRGIGLGYGVPLGVIATPYPYEVIDDYDGPVDSRQSRPPRRKTVVRERQPRKPVPGVTASGLSYVRYAPNTYPVCARGDGAMSGACNGRPFVADRGGNGPPSQDQNSGPRRNAGQAAATRNYLPGEIVAETGTMSDTELAALARRHRIDRIASQNFPLTDSTVSLFRIVGRRPVGQVQAELRADAAVRSAQPNFRYVLQDQKTVAAVAEGDPAQYALAKLRLPEAHTLAHGRNVTIAVIDSGIDTNHPELAGSIAASFDALDSKDGPHVHGTGIAGAIVAHARLMGGAPSARILAIRAFAVAQGTAESTSFAVLRSLDYAAAHGAQIVNMSFAGPKDALVSRGLAAVAAKGIVMVAASGNAGPTSPPLYPAADADVIAVSATDAHDRLFAASNRGSQIAVAAPGVDIFLPAPGGKYQITSGTSFSAAYVSGLVALILERNPALKPADVRAILTASARDLGTPGRDDLFGAGEADAYGALQALSRDAVSAAAGAVPVMAVSDPAPAAAASDAAAGTTSQAAPASEPQPAAAVTDLPAVDTSAK